MWIISQRESQRSSSSRTPRTTHRIIITIITVSSLRHAIVPLQQTSEGSSDAVIRHDAADSFIRTVADRAHDHENAISIEADTKLTLTHALIAMIVSQMFALSFHTMFNTAD